MAFTLVAEQAKQIRVELKKAFPGTKFSVRSKNYSGGSSIRVEWTDGPTTKAVAAIANQYESIDRDASGEILSGGNTYVFTDRLFLSQFFGKPLNGFVRIGALTRFLRSAPPAVAHPTSTTKTM
jgi:hypothetical protein